MCRQTYIEDKEQIGLIARYICLRNHDLIASHKVYLSSYQVTVPITRIIPNSASVGL